MISELVEFEKFLKICRKQGVKTVNIWDAQISFGDLPKKPGKEGEESEIETDELTPEQLMFFSAGGQ